MHFLTQSLATVTAVSGNYSVKHFLDLGVFIWVDHLQPVISSEGEGALEIQSWM